VILFLIHQFNCSNWNKTCLFKTACGLVLENVLLSQKFLGCKSTVCEIRKRGIVNALQLEAARAAPVPYRFNCEAMPSLKSLNLCIAIL